MRKRGKKGIFFSTDALLALLIIFLTILVVYPVARYSQYKSEIHRDIIKVLSNLKIGEIESVYVQQLINNGDIKDLNKSVLEQIGEFYVTDTEKAKNLSQEVISDIDIKENVGIWYGSTLLASRNSSPIETAQNIETERQIISGTKDPAQEGGATAFSARAFLTSALNKKYLYFGGYIGDGNISISAEYSGEIKNVEIEIAINRDFSIYINDIFSGHYENSSSEFTPASYDLSAYLSNFVSGTNTIKFVGSGGESLYIAGGFIKVIYNGSVQYEEQERYYFPGIEGMINIYDGFSIPGELNKIEIFLHINNNHTFFLAIGNTTVYKNSTEGEETIVIDDSKLSSLLNYSELSFKTTPLRLGIENASYVSRIGINADVFSVVDLSGSMRDSCVNENFICCIFSGDFCQSPATCDSCGGVWEEKLTAAKEANKVFVDIVLNTSGNKVGLVGYSNGIDSSDYHPLSDDNLSLKNKIDEWDAYGATCICCGINNATQELVASSSPERFRSIVVMSDGEANRVCSEQGTGDAKQDAIEAACTAYNDYGIRVYTIGFGSDADEETLQAIADCGNGTYTYSDITEIADVYQEVAQEIFEASYIEQTIEVIGELYSRLYPDSYIEFNYTKEETPFGLVVTSEKLFDDSYHGSFYVPPNSQILEAKVISYSGPRWTSNAEINNIVIYNLSEYGDDYLKLGDPYAISIPNSLIEENNVVRVLTGLSSQNQSEGSQSNKIIYSILENMSAYSEISATAEGCIWNLQFEDNSTAIINIPSTYSGTDECYYNESSHQPPEPGKDAVQSAVYGLLEKLDLDNDGKIDVKFAEQDLGISSSEIAGIPYTWATEVQIRKWR